MISPHISHSEGRVKVILTQGSPRRLGCEVLFYTLNTQENLFFSPVHSYQLQEHLSLQFPCAFPC